MPTKTGYSLLGGGGKGYINIGGWNTTLTDKSTTQMEVPGVKRREGANVYIYAKHGTQSAASAGLQVAIGTPAVDGIGTLVPPLVFTAIAAGGCKSATVQGSDGRDVSYRHVRLVLRGRCRLCQHRDQHGCGHIG